MNEEYIEQLLRKGPSIKTPEALLGKLKRDIHVPRLENGRTDWTPVPSWFRRWIPALTYAVILLSCVVAIAVQTNLISALRQQNAILLSTRPDLDALRAQNAELQNRNRQGEELDRLRKDNAELQKLRSELAQLENDMSSVKTLQAENQRLKAQLTAKQAAAMGMDTDTLLRAREDLHRIQCVNNLKQIGLAIRIYAGYNMNQLPEDFLSMSNELVTPAILQCPGDKTQITKMTNWQDFAAGHASYQFLVPGIFESEPPNTVVTICPIHHNVLYLDGRVEQLPDEITLKDGVTKSPTFIYSGKYYGP